MIVSYSNKTDSLDTIRLKRVAFIPYDIFQIGLLRRWKNENKTHKLFTL